jgi:hypothetical protein
MDNASLGAIVSSNFFSKFHCQSNLEYPMHCRSAAIFLWVMLLDHLLEMPNWTSMQSLAVFAGTSSK